MMNDSEVHPIFVDCKLLKVPVSLDVIRTPPRIPPARGQTKKPGWWFNMPVLPPYEGAGHGGGGGRGGVSGGGRGVVPTGTGSNSRIPTHQGGSSSYGQRGGGGSGTVGGRDRYALEQR